MRYRTSVAIPDGGAVILSGVSALTGEVNGEDTEVVLMLQAKVVQ